jgi:hypothetical protein
MFWRCRCCSGIPAFFAPCIVTNSQYPQGVSSVGLYGTNCKLLSALQDPQLPFQQTVQTTVLTPGNVQAGNSFNVTFGAPLKTGPITVGYTAQANTVEDVVTGLSDAINSYTLPANPPPGPPLTRTFNFRVESNPNQGTLTILANNVNETFNVSASATLTSTLTAVTTYPNQVPPTVQPLFDGAAQMSWNPIAQHLLISPWILQVGPSPKFEITLLSQLPPSMPDPNPGLDFGGNAPNISVFNALYAEDQSIWISQPAVEIFDASTGQTGYTTMSLQFTEQGQIVQAVLAPIVFITGGNDAIQWSPTAWAAFGATYVMLAGTFPTIVPNNIFIVINREFLPPIVDRPFTLGGTFLSMTTDGLLVQNGTQAVNLSGFVQWTLPAGVNVACADGSGNSFLVTSPGSNENASSLIKVDRNGKIVWSVPLPVAQGVSGICWYNGSVYLTARQTAANGNPSINRYALKDADGSLQHTDSDILPPNYVINFPSGSSPLQPWSGLPNTWAR